MRVEGNCADPALGQARNFSCHGGATESEGRPAGPFFSGHAVYATSVDLNKSVQEETEYAWNKWHAAVTECRWKEPTRG